MSGVKYSRIQLEQEQKARQEARNRINQLTANIQAFQQQINTLLAAIRRGYGTVFRRKSGGYWRGRESLFPLYLRK